MKKNITKSVVGAVKGVDKTVSQVERGMESVIEPMQKTVFTRFPILFTLLVTFGVVITLLALERIVVEFTYIYERPFLMLGIGLGLLTLTGTLYKKLG